MFLEKLSTYYILQLGVSNSDSSWVPTLCQMLLSFHFHHNLSQASWRLMFQIHTFQQMMGKIWSQVCLMPKLSFFPLSSPATLLISIMVWGVGTFNDGAEEDTASKCKKSLSGHTFALRWNWDATMPHVLRWVRKLCLPNSKTKGLQVLCRGAVISLLFSLDFSDALFEVLGLVHLD